MNLEPVQYFLDVVRRGSFAAAARERGVDPSVLSRAVAGLEATLGVRLLHRTTRRLTLTEAGAAYAARVEPLVQELVAAALQAGDATQRPAGTLRVASPVSFALLNVVPLIPALAERYPDLAIDLRLTDAPLDPISEGLDVAIRLGPLADSGLIARRLAPMVTVVCASPAYLARHGRPSVPADLASHECLLLDMPGFTDRWRFRDRGGEATEVRVRGRLRTSNALALKACALAGLGVVSQARWIVGRELRDGRLVDLFPEHVVEAAMFESPAVWLLYPTRAYLPLKVRAFAEFLQEAFADGPPWDAAVAADPARGHLP